VNKQALSLAVVIAGAYPAASNALGLGDIESNSHLNQPLRARIELLAASPADTNQLQVRLASPDVFNRVGVARPAFLNNLQFTPTTQGGKPVILVTSDAPIQEPFVNFLLEVSWPQGQLLKEYTVMLDPPVLMQPGNTVAGEASVRAEPKAAGTVRRTTGQRVTRNEGHQEAPQTMEVGAAATNASNVAANPNPAAVATRVYRVKPGDTLFKVASRVRQPGVSNEQMMMALFRANPKAFLDANINNLKVGTSLKAPKASEADNISRAEARRQIRQQNADWRNYRQTLAHAGVVPQETKVVEPTNVKNNTAKVSNASAKNNQARLEVLGSKDAKAVDKNNAVAAGNNAKLAELEKELNLARESLSARQTENQELKSRVSDLESMISKKNRLIALRNDQLAGLQKQLADNGVKTEPLAEMNEATGEIIKPATTSNTPTTPTTTKPANTTEPKDLQNQVSKLTDNNTVVRTDNPPATPPAPQTTSTPMSPAAAAMQGITPPLTTPEQATKPTPPVVTPSVEPPKPVATAKVEPKPVQVAPIAVDPTETTDDDWLSLLTSPLALQLGAGALGLLALLYLLTRFLGKNKGSKPPKNRKVMLDDTEITDNFDTHTNNFDAHSLEQELNKAENRSGYNKVSQDLFDQEGSQAWGNDTKARNADDAASAGSDKDDLITEANVYIAYGLYQQAESELKKGIERHPERLEYRHKLLECYFVANNREAFDRQAEQFASLSGGNKDKLWKSISEWGRKLSPDNKLYVENADLGALTKPAAVAAAATVGGAAALTSVQALAASEIPDEFDFDLDSLLAETAPEKTELPASTSVPAVKEMSSTAQPAAVSHELDELNSLDFDNLDLDKLLQEEINVASPIVSQESFTKKPEAEVKAAATALPEIVLPTAKPVDTLSDDGLLDFSMDMLEADKPAPTAPIISPESKAAEPKVEAPPSTAKAAPHVANLNLHLDNNSVNRILPKDTFYAPPAADDKDWLGDIDDALSFLDFPDEEIDLHEAHISTKLDLARAYLDMGDIEGARSTLEEVMVEGNDDQRREAETLLHQTG
jgi:pilus assembly protein FimV